MQPVPLNFTHYPCTGQALSSVPIIILHGLLGSGKNWGHIASQLQAHFTLYALDARNHGGSPHAEPFNIEANAADVLVFMRAEGLTRAHIVGHSMGGKTGMYLAANYPEAVHGLCVVDIAPKRNPAMHAEIEAMQALPLANITTRAQAEAAMEADVPNLKLRRFLLTNLVRTGAEQAGAFKWRIPLGIIHKHLSNMVGEPLKAGQQYTGPALWLSGARSNFVQPEDTALIKEHFPAATLHTIPSAGHNVHADAPEHVTEHLSDFFAAHAGS